MGVGRRISQRLCFTLRLPTSPCWIRMTVRRAPHRLGSKNSTLGRRRQHSPPLSVATGTTAGRVRSTLALASLVRTWVWVLRRVRPNPTSISLTLLSSPLWRVCVLRPAPWLHESARGTQLACTSDILATTPGHTSIPCTFGPFLTVSASLQPF